MKSGGICSHAEHLSLDERVSAHPHNEEFLCFELSATLEVLTRRDSRDERAENKRVIKVGGGAEREWMVRLAPLGANLCACMRKKKTHDADTCAGALQRQ